MAESADDPITFKIEYDESSCVNSEIAKKEVIGNNKNIEISLKILIFFWIFRLDERANVSSD